MYSQKVLDHFHHPRNAGELAGPDAVAQATNPVCGDLMKLWIAVRGDRIAEASFQVQGCIPAVACGSWLTEAIRGKSIDEVSSVSAGQIESALDGLPAASHHASALAIDALQQALKKCAHKAGKKVRK